MTEWQPIETAPKDGTRILAYGTAYKELAENGQTWIIHNSESPDAWMPFMTAIQWVEVWYDAEVDVGNGLFRKEPKLSSADWRPHGYAFRPTHWMLLPDPPVNNRGEPDVEGFYLLPDVPPWFVGNRYKP